MSGGFNLDPVTRLTAGAVGEPGQRTFYLQATAGPQTVSLLVEKGQVAALTRSIEALLDRLSTTHPSPMPGSEPSVDEMELVEPIEAEFRVGTMSLGYDADRDLIVLQCAELVAEPEDEPEDDVEDDDSGTVARFWASRAQMRALARHTAGIVAAGRPLCRLCNAPIDPEGHVCVALNGHRKDRDLS